LFIFLFCFVLFCLGGVSLYSQAVLELELRIFLPPSPEWELGLPVCTSRNSFSYNTTYQSSILIPPALLVHIFVQLSFLREVFHIQTRSIPFLLCALKGSCTSQFYHFSHGQFCLYVADRIYLVSVNTTTYLHISHNRQCIICILFC
jgi:hypothetical protein